MLTFWLCVAYFAQTFCENTPLWLFEQHLEKGKIKGFTRKTKGKNTGKSREETFFTQMSLL
jgi:hypothetical protein